MAWGKIGGHELADEARKNRPEGEVFAERDEMNFARCLQPRTMLGQQRGGVVVLCEFRIEIDSTDEQPEVAASGLVDSESVVFLAGKHPPIGQRGFGPEHELRSGLGERGK